MPESTGDMRRAPSANAAINVSDAQELSPKNTSKTVVMVRFN